MQSGKEDTINYKHIISSLVRKPAAFENYCYKESLFPNVFFRKSYDKLKSKYPTNGTKYYLMLLQLAATTSEREVSAALEILLEQKQAPSVELVKELVKSKNAITYDVFVRQPSIKEYDSLLSNMRGI